MLRTPITLLVLSLVAATLGFGVLANTAALLAQALFVLFLGLWALSLAGERLAGID